MKQVYIFLVISVIYFCTSESKLLIPLKHDYDSVFSYNLKTRNNERVLWTRGNIHLKPLKNYTIQFELKQVEVDRHEHVKLDLVHKAAAAPIWIELDEYQNLPNSNEVDWLNLDPRVILYPFALGNSLFNDEGKVNETIFDETNTYGGWSQCPPTIKVREDDKFVTLRLFFDNKKCKEQGTIFDQLTVDDFLEVNYYLQKKQKKIVKIEAHYKDYTYVREAEALATIEFTEFERFVESV